MRHAAATSVSGRLRRAWRLCAALGRQDGGRAALPQRRPDHGVQGYETADFPSRAAHVGAASRPAPCPTISDGRFAEVRAARRSRCMSPGTPNGTCVVPSDALVNDHQSPVLGATPSDALEKPASSPPRAAVHLAVAPLRRGVRRRPPGRHVPLSVEDVRATLIRNTTSLSALMYLGEGEVTCPEDYPEDVVLYDGMRDERHCTPCECGSSDRQRVLPGCSFPSGTACVTSCSPPAPLEPCPGLRHRHARGNAQEHEGYLGRSTSPEAASRAAASCEARSSSPVRARFAVKHVQARTGDDHAPRRAAQRRPSHAIQGFPEPRKG